jgi:hypothetical protein
VTRLGGRDIETEWSKPPGKPVLREDLTLMRRRRLDNSIDVHV